MREPEQCRCTSCPRRSPCHGEQALAGALAARGYRNVGPARRTSISLRPRAPRALQPRRVIELGVHCADDVEADSSARSAATCQLSRYASRIATPITSARAPRARAPWGQARQTGADGRRLRTTILPRSDRGPSRASRMRSCVTPDGGVPEKQQIGVRQIRHLRREWLRHDFALRIHLPKNSQNLADSVTPTVLRLNDRELARKAGSNRCLHSFVMPRESARFLPKSVTRSVAFKTDAGIDGLVARQRPAGPGSRPAELAKSVLREPTKLHVERRIPCSSRTRPNCTRRRATCPTSERRAAGRPSCRSRPARERSGLAVGIRRRRGQCQAMGRNIGDRPFQALAARLAAIAVDARVIHDFEQLNVFQST